MANKSEKDIEIKDGDQIEESQTDQIREEVYQEYDKNELSGLLLDRDHSIENLEQQVSELRDTVLRKAAELDNYRKRVQRERSQIYNSAKASALEDFLAISDDLTRTLHAIKEIEVPESFLEGITLLANKFDEVLKKQGVVRIDEEMVPFNVDLHDAMMRQKPEDESIESNTVLKVIENGYIIDGRVVRHAKVIVSE